MNLDDLTLGQIKEIGILLNLPKTAKSDNANYHPMLGKRCLIRTYRRWSAYWLCCLDKPQNSMEVKLSNSLRLWKWLRLGGLSLSAIANNGS